MKIIHVADLHFSSFRYGTKRDKFYNDADLEVANCLREITEQKPDLVLIAGDIYDNPYPDTSSRALFDEILVSYFKDIPTCIIPGNHDKDGDLSALMPEAVLLKEHPNIRFFHNVNCWHFPSRYFDLPASLTLYTLPYFRNDERQIKAFEELLELYHTTKADVNILLTHLMVNGAYSDSGRIIERANGNLIYELEEYFDYIALGDMHNYQCLTEKICYAGAPRHIIFPAFNIVPQPKGYIDLTIHCRTNPTNNEQFVVLSYQHITLRSARPFITIFVRDNNLSEVLNRVFKNNEVVRLVICSDLIPVGSVVDTVYRNGASFVRIDYWLESDNSGHYDSTSFRKIISETIDKAKYDDIELIECYLRDKGLTEEQIRRALDIVNEVTI